MQPSSVDTLSDQVLLPLQAVALPAAFPDYRGALAPEAGSEVLATNPLCCHTGCQWHQGYHQPRHKWPAWKDSLLLPGQTSPRPPMTGREYGQNDSQPERQLGRVHEGTPHFCESCGYSEGQDNETQRGRYEREEPQ